MRVTILGCGGSGGVPLIGGYWGACDPANPRNRRRRVSVHVEGRGASVLLDSSPDLRAQLLDAGIDRLDAVLFTHDHADHCHGIDDLRFLKPRRQGIPIEAWGNADTMAVLERRFDYIFRQSEVGSGVLYRPFLVARRLAGPFEIAGLSVTPFQQQHGMGSTSTGYRLGTMAYSTDVVGFDADAFRVLDALDLWIVDCLRFEPHPTHAHFDLVLEWVDRLRPKRTILTHMNHTVDYDEIARRCPPGIEPAHDGLTIELSD